MAITEGDRVVYAGGYGHDSSGAPLTATTPMPIASVSKSFTAMAVVRLAEMGKVELDAPVRDQLPEFRIADPRGARITVRQLLNHTSGITDRTLPEKSLPQPDSLRDAVARTRAATLAADPGTRKAYTNTNYHIAARLVEAVSGEPFAEHMRRHVFEPLGMRSTVTIDRPPRDLPPEVRRGHVYAYGAAIPAAEPDRFVNGSDGVITTAADMARWLIAQRNGTANGMRPVADVTAMHTPTDPQGTYGMGWEIDSEGRVGHTGVWFTYTADQLLLPGGVGIAVIGNSGIGLANESLRPLTAMLAGLMTDGAVPAAGPPVRLIADLILGVLALSSLLRGVRNLRRARAWARRRASLPGTVARLLPRLIPLALLPALPGLLGGFVGGGRDITFVQLCYYAPPLMVWAAVAAAMNTGVLVTRAVALTRFRAGNAAAHPSGPAR